MNLLRTICRNSALLAHLAVILILALPLFGHLDELPVQAWDELRNGQNALEMNNTGKLIVTTYDYAPETWNTKPPLFIWILALSFKLLGNTELALRLPSAIAAALTCILLLRFAKRHTGTWWTGIVSVIILVTIPGYVIAHGTRTGDYDALLVLCTTASVFWLHDFLEAGSRRWLYLSAAALIAAALTKGVAGVLSCPAMLCYVLLRGKAAWLLRQRALYLCAAAFLLIVGGYYGLRELQQPGYLQAVVVNELGGRFNTVIPGIQPSDHWAYYNELVDVAFKPWVMLIIPAGIAAFAARRQEWRWVGLLCGLQIVLLLLILSGASTRLWWYMMPIYPALSLLCGMFVVQAMTVLRRWKAPSRVWRLNFLPLLALALLAAAPYKDILDLSIGDKFRIRQPEMHEVGLYLKEAISGARPLNANGLCGIDPFYFRWYQEVLRGRGARLDEMGVDTLQAGAQVIVWNQSVKDQIRERYRQSEVENFRSVTIFRIEGVVADTAAAVR